MTACNEWKCPTPANVIVTVCKSGRITERRHWCQKHGRERADKALNEDGVTAALVSTPRGLPVARPHFGGAAA